MPDETRLKYVVAPVNEKTKSAKDPTLPYIGLEHIPSRGSMLLGTASSATSVSTNSVFQRGDILFGKLRPNLRKVLLAPFSGYCSTDLLVLRAKEGVDAQFAGWLMRSEQIGAAAERTAIGTKMPRTSWTLLKEEKIFCRPHCEQHLIARILNSLDTQTRQTEEVIAKLKQVQQGLLTDLLTRGIDENGELRPPAEEAPHLYKDSPLGTLPKDWDVVSIGGMATKVTNGFVGVATPYYTTSENGIPYLYGNNVRSDQIDLRGIRYVTRQFHSANQKSQLLPGDMLTVQSGHIGTTAVVPEDVGEANCHALIITRFIQDRIDPRFASFFLNSPKGLQAQRRLFIGSTILHINTSDFARMQVPVPGLVEQRSIVAEGKALKERLAGERRMLTVLTRLRTGLMEDLLTGRVRVTSLLEETEQAAG